MYNGSCFTDCPDGWQPDAKNVKCEKIPEVIVEPVEPVDNGSTDSNNTITVVDKDSTDCYEYWSIGFLVYFPFILFSLIALGITYGSYLY